MSYTGYDPHIKRYTASSSYFPQISSSHQQNRFASPSRYRSPNRKEQITSYKSSETRSLIGSFGDARSSKLKDINDRLSQ